MAAAAAVAACVGAVGPDTATLLTTAGQRRIELPTELLPEGARHPGARLHLTLARDEAAEADQAAELDRVRAVVRAALPAVGALAAAGGQWTLLAREDEIRAAAARTAPVADAGEALQRLGDPSARVATVGVVGGGAGGAGDSDSDGGVEESKA